LLFSGYASLARLKERRGDSVRRSDCIGMFDH
jgi:hypothetical protein